MFCLCSTATKLQSHDVNQNSASTSHAPNNKRRERDGEQRKQQERAWLKPGGGETRAADNWHLKGKQKYTSEQSEPTRFSALYNFICSGIMWKMLVVDSVGLPAKDTFWKLCRAPAFRAEQRSKQKKKKKDVQETHFLNSCRRKLFTTGKRKPSLPAPKHGGFSSLITAVRFHSVNSKLLIYKMSCFSWKRKKEDGQMYKPSK